jgi:hypothetical protein
MSLLAGLFCLSAHAQVVTVAIEQHNHQTGSSTFTTNEYTFATDVEEYPSVSGGTVSATSGDLNSASQSLSADGDDWEYVVSETNSATLISSFPFNNTYSVTTTGTPSGTVVISSPNDTLSNLLPDAPVFTISGVTGTWVGNTFKFNPADVTTSFTVTISDYSVTSSGGQYGYSFTVGDISGSYSAVGGMDDGPIDDSTDFTPIVFTFTKGAANDAGDGDDTTYGFVDGSHFEIEGNFSNVYNFGDSEFGSGNAEAFIIGSNTIFNLQAVPEPSSVALWAGVVVLSMTCARRRRR